MHHRAVGPRPVLFVRDGQGDCDERTGWKICPDFDDGTIRGEHVPVRAQVFALLRTDGVLGDNRTISGSNWQRADDVAQVCSILQLRRRDMTFVSSPGNGPVELLRWIRVALLGQGDVCADGVRARADNLSTGLEAPDLVDALTPVATGQGKRRGGQDDQAGRSCIIDDSTPAARQRF